METPSEELRNTAMEFLAFLRAGGVLLVTSDERLFFQQDDAYLVYAWLANREGY